MANTEQIGAYSVPMPQRQVKPSGDLPVKSPGVDLSSRGRVGAAAPKASKPEPATLPKELSLNEIAKILNKVNLRFDLFEISAKFSIDETSGGILIEVRNNKTGEVIRRIPPYEAIRVLMDQGNTAGLLLDQKV